MTRRLFEKFKTQVQKAGWSDVFNENRRFFDVQESEAAYDTFDDFLKWLRKNKIPYDYVCGARYEYNGDLRKWRPGMRKEAVTTVDSSNDPILLPSVIATILKKLDGRRCNTKKLAAFIRHDILKDIPPLPELSIDEEET